MDMVEDWRNSITHPVEIYWPYIPSLRWPEIRRVMFCYTGIYDGSEIDTLMVFWGQHKGGVTIDADEYGDLMFRYDSETGDVIGLYIEDFESHFLKKYSKYADGWAVLKPEGKNGKHNSPWLADSAALGYARRLADMAYQGTLAPGWPFEDLGPIAIRGESTSLP